MEISMNPFPIDYNIARMTENFVPEDPAFYEECSICYESFTDKSFINECLHPFCYKCITDWTQVKAVCPLCIRPITKVLHNIRSLDDYDIKEIEPPKIDVLAEIESDFIFGIDDTDTDSSYGGMESMDADSDADVEYGDDFNFDDDNFGGNTINVFEYLSDNEEFHDNEEYYDGDASVHSSNETESDDDVKVENDDNNENHSSDDSSENEDDANDFFNTVSDFEIEEEHEEEEEYDCDLNEDDEDDDADEEYSESNYFDNLFEDAENFDEEEQENELETFDVSDDTEDECEEDSEQSISDDDDYYLSDRC